MVEDQKLMDFFKFDETDLKANRKGRLSERQLKPILAEKRFEHDSVSWGLGILFFIVAIVGMVGGLTGVLHAPITFEKIMFGLFFGVLWPYIWGRMGVKMITRIDAKKKPRVKTENGRIRVIKHEHSDSVPYYEMRVGELRFEMDEDPAGAVVQKGQYAVYYLEKDKKILSIEPVSNAR